MSDVIMPPEQSLKDEEIHPGLIVAIEFRLGCGHYVHQALRSEDLVLRYQVDNAMTAAADKLAFWLTRQAFPHHDCNLVTEANPNGFPILSRNEVH